jgi:mycoredoxin
MPNTIGPEPAKPLMERITVYGSDTCDDTRRSRAQLEAWGVHYDFIDVDRDQLANAFATGLGGGALHTPTITLGGDVHPIVAPTNEELKSALLDRQLIPDGRAELL